MPLDRRRADAGVVAAIVLVLIIVAATQVRFDPNSIDRNWTGIPIPPCFIDAMKCYGHVLGTDEIGRDILARLMYGGIVSLGIPLIAVIVEVALGVGITMLARGGGPIVRFVVQQFETALWSFPPWAFLLAMIAIGAPHQSPTLSITVLALLAGLVFSPRIVRVVRSTSDSPARLAALFDRAAYDLTRLVPLVATLNFFWLGAQEPTPSWGSMLRNVQENLNIGWWAVAFPALALFGAALVIETLRRLLFGSVTREAAKVEPSVI